ncbi:hypothetical protein BC832DRAFT_563044 [Gaertneriomyces semiglobifer]|nr:hypothetical protein BC832DRAFT_563044 [Gaertneriomyces semiglobifer]
MMTANKPSITFDIVLDENSTSAGSLESIDKSALSPRLQRKLQEGTLRKSVSQEEIEQRLSQAESRRRSIEESRVQRAKEAVEHAKSIAEQVRQQKEEEASQMRQSLEKRIEDAEARRESMKTTTLSATSPANRSRSGSSSGISQEEIEEKLQAAETRRLQIEAAKKAKLAEDHARVEEVKARKLSMTSSAGDSFA